MIFWKNYCERITPLSYSYSWFWELFNLLFQCFDEYRSFRIWLWRFIFDCVLEFDFQALLQNSYLSFNLKRVFGILIGMEIQNIVSGVLSKFELKTWYPDSYSDKTSVKMIRILLRIRKWSFKLKFKEEFGIQASNLKSNYNSTGRVLFLSPLLSYSI